MSEAVSETVRDCVSLLKRGGLTVATAESCTAGMLSAAVTAVPGASAVFELGVAAYSCRIKQKILGVRAETLQEYGAVSRQTAGEMAAGVRRLSGADIGLSVTGVAGPDSSEGKLPGTVYIALADARAVRAEKLTIEPVSREAVRKAACDAIFELLHRYLERRSTDV